MTEALQFLFNGFALGCVYALVAVGFTVIYRSSQVVNFAQGSFVLLGAYLVAWLHVDRGLPFGVAVGLAAAACAVGAAAFQRAALRRAAGRPVFVIVMITLGLDVVLSAAVPAAFGVEGREIYDPWGASTVHLAGVTLAWLKIWAAAGTVAVLAWFFAFDRFSRYGLAMRAAADDEEAALAAGVPVDRVHTLSWAMAGGLAVVAGVFLAGFPNRAEPLIGLAGLRAFPAIILGGLGSPAGAVVGGILIGQVEVLTAGYQPAHAPWLGDDFHIIAPYLVMLLVLLVRPHGLLGRSPMERA